MIQILSSHKFGIWKGNSNKCICNSATKNKCPHTFSALIFHSML